MNLQVQELYNELHPSVLSQIAHVINICKKHGVETSICGQAGSKREMVAFLIKQEISSISVNADAASEIAEYVSELEKNLSSKNTIKNNVEQEPINQEFKVHKTNKIQEINKTPQITITKTKPKKEVTPTPQIAPQMMALASLFESYELPVINGAEFLTKVEEGIEESIEQTEMEQEFIYSIANQISMNQNNTINVKVNQSVKETEVVKKIEVSNEDEVLDIF